TRRPKSSGSWHRRSTRRVALEGGWRSNSCLYPGRKRMIANECEVISNSLWTATSRPLPSWSPLAGEAETEVAVIGGGFTGLSAALHLAEQGIAVTLLEAETPGWGASGRNGGQVNPGLKEDPDGIEARFGEEMGRRMIALSGGAPEFTFKLIERLDIACAPVRKGWIQPVHTESAEARVRARAEQWSRRGEPVRMLSREDTAYLLGTDAYRCAMLDERGGNLH